MVLQLFFFIVNVTFLQNGHTWYANCLVYPGLPSNVYRDEIVYSGSAIYKDEIMLVCSCVFFFKFVYKLVYVQ